MYNPTLEKSARRVSKKFNLFMYGIITLIATTLLVLTFLSKLHNVELEGDKTWNDIMINLALVTAVIGYSSGAFLVIYGRANLQKQAKRLLEKAEKHTRSSPNNFYPGIINQYQQYPSGMYQNPSFPQQVQEQQQRSPSSSPQGRAGKP